MAKDWINIAAGLGVSISDPERVRASLDSLEKAFRPLASEIPHDVEPALIFRAAPEPGE